VPTIRPAGPSDESAIEAVYEAAIRAFGPEAYDDVQVAAWAADGVDETGQAVGDVAGGDDRHVFVAEENDEIVGFGRVRCDAVPDAPPDRLLELVDCAVAEVTAVYVHPDHARAGVGSAILAALEDRAREAGATVVGLLAARNAVAFYEANGYEPMGRQPLELADGVALAGIWMERRLAPE
jgi:putative acetyltransferase